MSSQMDTKTMILYLSSIALALFYLVYMPYTALSALVTDPGLLWIYYFTLVLGLVFPLYYAIGDESTAWICLGLAVILNSVLWMMVQAAQMMAALMTLIVGVLLFLQPILEKRMKNWDLMKNVFHILIGLFIILAAGFYANWLLPAFIGATSYNHYMPQFLFMGGALFVVYAFVLLLYGLFNIIGMKTGGKAKDFIGKLAKLFYMLLVLVYLIGITYNIIAYTGTFNWGAVTATPIVFFAGWGLGGQVLGSILLLLVYLYGLGKIAEKQ